MAPVERPRTDPRRRARAAAWRESRDTGCQSKYRSLRRLADDRRIQSRSQPSESNVPGASRVLRMTAVNAPRTCAGETPSGSARRSAALREQLKGAASIRQRAADCRKAAVRRDQAFLNRGIASRTLVLACGELFPRRHLAADDVQDIQQHRVNHEAVVVVPVKRRTIAVDAVSLVPLVVLAERVVHTHPIPGCAKRRERRFHRCGKEQPVVEAGEMMRVDSSAAMRFRRVAGSSAARSARGARSSPCARNAASTSGWRSRVKLRKSGDDGSTAREIARHARSAYSARRRPSGEPSGASSTHEARPATRRPSASRCVTFCRFAPAACSTGIRAFSVPAARFFRTGSASRRM